MNTISLTTSRPSASAAATILLFASTLHAAEIKVMTSGAFSAAYTELVPQFERSTKDKVITLSTSMGTGSNSILSRLQRGEAVDVVIIADAMLDELIRRGKVAPGSKVGLARSSIGMAVRAGAPKPDISSVDALKRTLLKAKSIAYSSSVSGTYLSTELFPRLGIADQIMGKSKRIDEGPVGAAVARGDAEIGFQQISELLPVSGIDYVGPLPAEVQRVTVFSAGIASNSKVPDAARALIKFLALHAAASAIKRSGMEPLTSFDADTLPRATPESVGVSSQRLQRIARALHTEIDNDQMPGAVIAIARRGKLIYYESFGFLDKGSGTPMPKDAIFSIASMTKPLVAVGALALYEENRLLVHDPVSKYLSQLKEMKVAVIRQDQNGKTIIATEPARRQPTIQDLMRHTAGLTYGNQGTTELHKLYPASTESLNLNGTQFLETLGKLPLFYQPGTMWDYSFGFDVLGLAIESVTSETLSRYLSERLFEPLGMIDTAFTLPIEKANRVAKALPIDPVTGRPQVTRDPTRARKFDCGGGCAASTAIDYLRFAQMLLNRGNLGDTRILGRKTVEYMTADHLGPGVNIDHLQNFPVDHLEGYGFGLGVAVGRGSGVSGVMGSPGDYHWSGSQGTYFWVDPSEELAVVFMAVTPGEIRAHYRQVIPALVLQAIVD